MERTTSGLHLTKLANGDVELRAFNAPEHPGEEPTTRFAAVVSQAEWNAALGQEHEAETERFDAPGCQMCGAPHDEPCDCHDPQGPDAAAVVQGDKHGAAPFGTRGTMSPTDATIWWCENCQTKGRVEVASDAGVWEVFQTLGDLHRTAAPKCARKHGTAGVRVVPALPSTREPR
jgi:hypothetical protein